MAMVEVKIDNAMKAAILRRKEEMNWRMTMRVSRSVADKLSQWLSFPRWEGQAMLFLLIAITSSATTFAS